MDLFAKSVKKNVAKKHLKSAKRGTNTGREKQQSKTKGESRDPLYDL